MDVWELAAREGVRDTIAHYNLAGDRGHVDDMMSLFAPDATLTIDGVAHGGHAEILAVLSDAKSPHPELIRHFTSTLQIEVPAPDRANARCYFQVLTVNGLDHWGRYTDVLKCVDGRWLFTSRSVRIDGATPGGWAHLRGYPSGGARGEQTGRHDVP